MRMFLPAFFDGQSAKVRNSQNTCERVRYKKQGSRGNQMKMQIVSQLVREFRGLLPKLIGRALDILPLGVFDLRVFARVVETHASDSRGEVAIVETEPAGDRPEEHLTAVHDKRHREDCKNTK